MRSNSEVPLAMTVIVTLQELGTTGEGWRRGGAHPGLDGSTVKLGNGRRRLRGSRSRVEDFVLGLEAGVPGPAPAHRRRGQQRRDDSSAQSGAEAAMASTRSRGGGAGSVRFAEEV
jgi:hypothetical protein